MILIT